MELTINNFPAVCHGLRPEDGKECGVATLNNGAIPHFAIVNEEDGILAIQCKSCGSTKVEVMDL